MTKPSMLGRVSLRARLLLIAIALAGVGLAVGSTIMIGALDRYQTGRIDERLRAAAGAMASRAAVPADRNTRPQDLTPVFDVLGFTHLTYLRPDGSTALAVYRPGVEGRPGPRLPVLNTARVAAHRGRAFDVPGERGSDHWRVVALPLSAAALPAGGRQSMAGSSVVVAASRHDVDATLARMRVTGLVTGALILAALAVVGWFAVGGGLRPLRRVEATAAAIAGGDLSRRIPGPEAPRTEIGRLRTALNGMLAQLERAFAARTESEARMRRFVADVSHELRTPLAGIKGFSELYRLGGLPEEGDVGRTMDRIEREAGRLANLTEDLLLLARLDDRSSLPLDLHPMDLRTLAADAQHDVHALDPSRPISLTGPGGGPPSSAPVLGDEERLRQVVSNLVGNAVAHTPAGGGIRIGVGTVDGRAVIEIEDHGPGLTAPDADRIFDRFYRVDGSRTRSEGGGAGLGLAIAQSLVAAHDGRIELETAPGEGARFRVSLPVAE
jgi:two-component system, OmpR family, sensor kinase